MNLPNIYSFLLNSFKMNSDVFFSSVHDCRPEGLQDTRDPGLWQAQLLKHGLDQTYDDVTNLHTKDETGQRHENRQ